MLWVDLGEAVGILNDVVEAGAPVLDFTTVENTTVQNLGSHAQAPAGLLSNSGLISRDHLDLNAHADRLVNGLLGVLPGGVEEAEDAQEDPVASVVGLGNPESPVSPISELLNGSDNPRPCRLGGVAHVEDDVAHSLASLENLASTEALDGGNGLLTGGVEGDEFELLKILQPLGHLRLTLTILGDAEIDGVLALLHPLGGKCGVEDQFAGGNIRDDDGLVKLELVLRESSGLVGAKHVHTGHLLDSSKPGNDYSHIGELSRSYRHRTRTDDLHRDGDARNHENNANSEGPQQVHALAQKNDHDGGDDDNSEAEQAHGNLEKYLLETTNVLDAVDHGSSLAEEGVLAGGGDVGLELAPLDGRAHLSEVSRVKGNGEGFPSEGSLVDGEGGTLEKLAVGRHDVSELQVNDIPRNEKARIHVLPPSLPLNSAAGCK
mmetsp:Transcript_15814/g.32496  ORF Transcript_15814/g.32496 Transcript_15814/m.32496 type:complete len:434 (+) Transcript_15814:1412-2713(+)